MVPFLSGDSTVCDVLGLKSVPCLICLLRRQREPADWMVCVFLWSGCVPFWEMRCVPFWVCVFLLRETDIKKAILGHPRCRRSLRVFLFQGALLRDTAACEAQRRAAQYLQSQAPMIFHGVFVR